VAALRDDFYLKGSSLRRRIVLGSVVTGIGALLMGWSLFGSLETVPLLIVLSVGALMVFVGVNLLSPTVASRSRRSAFDRQPARLVDSPRARRNHADRVDRRCSMIGLASEHVGCGQRRCGRRLMSCTTP
jgi:hypothetical protein